MTTFFAGGFTGGLLLLVSGVALLFVGPAYGWHVVRRAFWVWLALLGVLAAAVLGLLLNLH